MKLRLPVKQKSLRTRLFLLSVAGMLSLLLVLGFSGYYSIRKSQDELLSERLLVAQILASNLESLIGQNLSYLQNTTFFPGWNPNDENPDPERLALHSARLQSIFSKVFLFDPDGTILRTEPERTAGAEPDYTKWPDVMKNGKTFLSGLKKINGHYSVFCLVPLRTGGSISGFIGGEIHLESDILSKDIRDVRIGKTGHVEVLDQNGFVIASSQRGRLFRKHDPVSQLVVSTPLKKQPWTLNILQSRQEAFASVEGMKKRIFLVGFFFLLIALPLVWAVTDSIISPVRSLIASSKKISAGYLNDPVPVSGDDEIGVLGKVLNEMRIKIRDLLTEIESTNRELEKRVEARTQEVTRLFEVLKRKEEMRGTLLRKIISAQEEERKRIARDLHDDLSQILATLLLALEKVRDSVRDAAGTAEIDRIQTLSVRAIDSIHRMIFDLRPAVLDDLGLAVAIRWYAEQRLKPLNISCYFEGNALDLRLDSQIEIALFRIAQEAMNNIAKHSKADNVMISFERKNGSVVLTVEDDGEGFQPLDESPKGIPGHGFGLQGMKERVELLDGTISIDSSAEAGTRIVVSVPTEEVNLVYG